MDFQHPDIRRYLVDAIPSRFHHLSPAEFESFIAHLFRIDGYEVSSVADQGFASTLKASKDKSSLVIRLLRFPPDYPVQEEEIQKVLAAQAFFEAEQSWLITTSFFSKEAINAAEAADVEYWDWDMLYQTLCQTFFEGQSHLEFSASYLAQPGVIRDPELKLKAKWKPEEGIGSEWYNLDITISNPAERNIYIHLDLPAVIDSKKNQITAEKWADAEFVSGIIYEGASVRTNALFKASRLGERPPGGRVMLTCHERTDPPSTYHLAAKLKGQACYIVTFCYGMESEEYKAMITYRDQVLSQNLFGRLLIAGYYAMAPFLVKVAQGNRYFAFLLKRVTMFAIPFFIK